MRNPFIAAAIIASILTLGQARAETAQHVSYADLDLAKPRDIARLNRRVAGAVEQVCGSYATAPRDQEDIIAVCRRQAMTSYRAQLAGLPAAVRLAAR